MRFPLTICTLLVMLGIFPALHAWNFDELKRAGKKERREQAEKICRQQVMQMKPGEAEAELRGLAAFARGEKDRDLEMLAYLWLGNYHLMPGRDAAAAVPFFEEGLKLAKQYDDKIWEAEFTYRAGKAHLQQKIYPKAFESLLQADALIHEIGYDRFPEVNNFLFDIGRAYYDFADYRKAQDYFLEALNHPFTQSPNSINIYNTLALTYMKLQETELALKYFHKGLEEARREQDSAWVGIISGNLGNIYMQKGSYDTALPLLRTDYELSVRNRQWTSAGASLLLIAEIMIRADSLETAAKMIAEAEAYNREMKAYWLSRDLYQKKALLSGRMNDYRSAYYFQDTAMMYKDSVLAANDQSVLKQAEVKISTEKYLAERKLRESERRKQALMINAGVVILLLGGLVFYMFYNRQQLRRKKDREIFLLEKQRFEAELNNAENMLQSYMDNLREKNQLVEKFRADLEQLQLSSDPVLSNEREQVIEKLYHSAILTEDDWNEFRRLFEKVHADFFGKLKGKYPDLTLAETRLLALTKLQLSVSEMAHMLGISPNSVRKTSLRLRKKLNMENGTDLSELVENI